MISRNQSSFSFKNCCILSVKIFKDSTQKYQMFSVQWHWIWLAASKFKIFDFKGKHIALAGLQNSFRPLYRTHRLVQIQFWDAFLALKSTNPHARFQHSLQAQKGDKTPGNFQWDDGNQTRVCKHPGLKARVNVSIHLVWCRLWEKEVLEIFHK